MSWWSNLLNGGAAAVPVQESLQPYVDPDVTLTGSQAVENWRRITQSPADLKPFDQERMHDVALYLSDRNPLAKGILDVIVSFVVGEGVVVTSKDTNVKTIIDRFWNDAINDMDDRVDDLTRELAIFGEQVLLAFVNESSGRVAVVSVDPRQIRAVRPDPIISDKPLAVGFADPEQTLDYRWLKILDEDSDPNSDTFGRLVGARRGETLKVGDRTVKYYEPPEGVDGTRLVGCFYWAVNKPRASMRGRSDLLSVADTADALDTFLFDEGQRMSMQRAFVWDVMLRGKSQGEIEARAAASAPPMPGSVNYHNENEEWNVLAPSLNTADSVAYADLQLSQVATALGLPKTWLNGSMDVNRATAAEMSEPGYKRMVRRQKYVRRMIERIVRFTLDQAELAGTLKKADDARHEFTVSMPEMSSRDLQRGASAMLTSAQAMGMSTAAGWLDDQTAQDAIVLLLGQLGVDVDVKDVRQRLEDAAQNAAQDERIPEYFGLGASAGPDNLTRALGNGVAHTNGTNGVGGIHDMVPVVSPAAKDLAAVISQVSKALVDLGNAGVLDTTTAQEVLSRLLEPFGIAVTPDEINSRLADDAATRAAQAAPSGDAGVAGGATPAPGPAGAGNIVDLDQLALEVFTPSQHPRDTSGRFKDKPDAATAAGAGGADTPASAPTRTRKPATPTVSKAELGKALKALEPDDDISLTLANGTELSGKVVSATDDAAVVQLSDGSMTILHTGLKGIASITTPNGTATASPAKPRTRRDPNAPRTPRAPRTAGGTTRQPAVSALRTGNTEG